MLCVLCLIVLWGFSLVTSYSGVIDIPSTYLQPAWSRTPCSSIEGKHTPRICYSVALFAILRCFCSVRANLSNTAAVKYVTYVNEALKRPPKSIDRSKTRYIAYVLLYGTPYRLECRQTALEATSIAVRALADHCHQDSTCIVQ